VPFVQPQIRPTVPAAVRTRLAESQPAGSVRCGVCAHRCLVRPDRTGICGVRENRDGVLYLTVYGAVAAIGVDPIEKKPLFHVAPGTLAYSIATPGCPFHCTFCQNWEIAQAPRLGSTVPTRQMSPQRVVDEALDHGAAAIAYTYVEPTVFLEYALDTARLAHDAGLLNLFVTDGYATPEAIDLLAPVLDAANVDLKSFSDAFYRHRCGARLASVLEALEAYRKAGTWLEVTTLVIPGLNDDPGELRELATWLVEHLGAATPWHVSRFFPAFRMLDVPRTPIATLRRAVEIGREAGLLHVYAGNSPELGLESTRCAGCGAVLLERQRYHVFSHLGDDGSCPSCGRLLEGRALSKGPRDPGALQSAPCG
jgi:pyruvate formate lyase activating enzyme